MLLNREPGGPSSLGASFLYRILSPTYLITNSSDLPLQLLNRGPEGPHCWVLAFSTASSLQLTDFLSLPWLYNNLTSTLLPASFTISHSFNPSTGKVIISWYSSTRCYLHRCISYFDRPAGSEVNIQHQAETLLQIQYLITEWKQMTSRKKKKFILKRKKNESV